MNFNRTVWALGVVFVSLGLAGSARADLPGMGGGGGAGGGGTTATTGSTTAATTAGSGGGSSGGDSETTEDSCTVASVGARTAAGAVSGVALLGLVAASLTIRRRRDKAG